VPRLNCGVMRHIEYIALSCLATSIAACSSMDPYAWTAASLTEIERTWAPLDKADFYVPSKAEHSRSSSDIASCVDEFSQRLARNNEINRQHGLSKWVPSREERVVDLVGCMQLKGWHLVAVEPIIVTSAA
jgi:hypothetical protein